MRASGSRSILGLIHFDPQRRAVFLAGGKKAGNGQIGIRRLFRKPSKPMRSTWSSRRRSEQPPLNNPNAHYWDDPVEDFGFTQRSKRRCSCMPASRPQGPLTRALLERMEADGIIIAERDDEPAYAAFTCPGPGGHRIEAYREPPSS
jgi:hypothetical protein